MEITAREFMDVSVEGHTGLLVLNKPKTLNAMTRQMYRDISSALKELDAHPDVRSIVIASDCERAFSSGADLDVLHTVLAADELDWTPYEPERFDTGLRLSKPVIAAVNGFCLAGGFELALSCDIRVAAKNAVFATPEVKWSVLHGFGALALPRLAPLGAVYEMLFTGERIDAAEAYRLGIVNRVVPVEDLRSTAMALSEKINANGPIAIRMTKELIGRGLEQQHADVLRVYRELNRLVHTAADATEGMKAWNEKRVPQYEGR